MSDEEIRIALLVGSVALGVAACCLLFARDKMVRHAAGWLGVASTFFIAIHIGWYIACLGVGFLLAAYRPSKHALAETQST
jgi:hypothetical protein